MQYFAWWVPFAGTKQFLHSEQLLHFNEFYQNGNPKDIHIIQMTNKILNWPLNFSIGHQSTSNYHFWSIDWGTYNRLKLLVKATPGFDRLTLI